MTYTAAPAILTNVNVETVTCDGYLTHSVGVEEPCGYEGDARVDIIGRDGFTITVDWDCPRCATNHTEDRDIRDEN